MDSFEIDNEAVASQQTPQQRRQWMLLVVFLLGQWFFFSGKQEQFFPTSSDSRLVVSTSGGGCLTSSSRQTPTDSSNVTVSMIVVMSGQRSSSSEFSKALAGMPCHTRLNEILNKGVKGSPEAWNREGKELGLLGKDPRHIQPSVMAEFVVRVAQRHCHEMLQNRTMAAENAKCHNHCFVNYKHLLTPKYDVWWHPLLWDAMQERLQHQQQHLQQQQPPFVMAILERNVTDRWRSYAFAQQTGDWNTQGAAAHKKKLEHVNVPPMPDWFEQEHKQWYRMGRKYVRHTNIMSPKRGLPRIPIMEMTFDHFTQHGWDYAQEQFQTTIHNITTTNNN